MADPILAVSKATKKAGNKCGVYRIDCTGNGKFYIGSSTEIPRRLRAHRHALRGGYHANVKFQAAWNKYGEDAFKYSIVRLCDEAESLEHEQQLIDDLQAVRRGLNLSLSATAPMAGRTHTAEARAKIGAAVSGRIDSPETSVRRSTSAKARGEATSAQMREIWKTRDQSVIDKIAASNTGQKRSAEACANIGAATKARWESQEYRDKISLAWVSRREAGVSDETRTKLSESMIEKWKNPEIRKKFSAVHVGRKRSDETKAKMRVAALAREARKREAAQTI